MSMASTFVRRSCVAVSAMDFQVARSSALNPINSEWAALMWQSPYRLKAGSESISESESGGDDGCGRSAEACFSACRWYAPSLGPDERGWMLSIYSSSVRGGSESRRRFTLQTLHYSKCQRSTNTVRRLCTYCHGSRMCERCI